jgi:hypothetical protein
MKVQFLLEPHKYMQMQPKVTSHVGFVSSPRSQASYPHVEEMGKFQHLLVPTVA